MRRPKGLGCNSAPCKAVAEAIAFAISRPISGFSLGRVASSLRRGRGLIPPARDGAVSPTTRPRLRAEVRL